MMSTACIKVLLNSISEVVFRKVLISSLLFFLDLIFKENFYMSIYYKSI